MFWPPYWTCWFVCWESCQSAAVPSAAIKWSAVIWKKVVVCWLKHLKSSCLFSKFYAEIRQYRNRCQTSQSTSVLVEICCSVVIDYNVRSRGRDGAFSISIIPLSYQNLLYLHYPKCISSLNSSYLLNATPTDVLYLFLNKWSHLRHFISALAAQNASYSCF